MYFREHAANTDAMSDNFPGPGYPTGPTVDQLAEVLSAVTTIGRACAEFRKAGWHSTIAGNRITVNDETFARYIDGCSDPDDVQADSARWLVYDVGDCPQVRMVAAAEVCSPSPADPTQPH
jgi:hypothetical protein